ncbi:DUF1501 domain-containing protein [Chloroflexus sp.]|uniref:DUF1501 domain-containing protein n=1 Tax=Chloroflexus sp. TaxID=1904827 RepID=UPI002ADE82C2|nr:DUF1501 domain-containing protein [Chloroflexus sp.]
MQWTRREFLMGCSAAIAAMAAARVGQLAFAEPAQPQATNEIFVQIFLRGGCDGLSLLSPYDDSNYRSARGTLALPLSGANAPLRIDQNNPSFNTSSFGLNSRMPHLRDLYNSGHLAFIHACGLDDDTRSHFDAMDYIERGTPGNKTTSSGWLTRHLQTQGGVSTLLPAIAANSAPPASLLDYTGAVAVTSPSSFNISTIWRYNRPQDNYPFLSTLREIYSRSSINPLAPAGRRVTQVIDVMRSLGSYTPATGTTYPSGSFGDALKTVAQLIKADLGLQVATIDFGGWDTHEAQANSDGTGYLPDRLGILSQGLHAFYNDLNAYHSRLTIVVLSEFGRRLGRNLSNGTDHGHGNVMMVLGGNVNGRRIYGTWPGLHPDQLDKRQDLQITTDYRQVLSEILVRRLGNPKLGTIFPGLSSYTPLGIVRGPDLPPDLSATATLADTGYQVFVPVVHQCR